LTFALNFSNKSVSSI